jgi:hypothetical protein
MKSLWDFIHFLAVAKSALGLEPFVFSKISGS